MLSTLGSSYQFVLNGIFTHFVFHRYSGLFPSIRFIHFHSSFIVFFALLFWGLLCASIRDYMFSFICSCVYMCVRCVAYFRQFKKKLPNSLKFFRFFWVCAHYRKICIRIVMDWLGLAQSECASSWLVVYVFHLRFFSLSLKMYSSDGHTAATHI